jgi:putative tryptophan/tyrosine transport system substrate-binding protein
MEEKSAQVESDSTQEVSLPGAQASSPSSRKNKPFWIIPIGIIVALLVAGAIGWYFWINSAKTQTAKIYHIGILSGIAYFSDTQQGFKEKMTEFGYIEGKNVAYDLHQTDFDLNIYNSILEKFISNKSDLILVFPTEAAQVAKSLTAKTNIPVIFIGANVEDANLIKSVGEPGGNITGVRWTGSDIALLRFEVMREIVPQTKRFLIAFQRGVSIVGGQLAAIHSAADKDNIKILEIPADNVSELEAKLKSTIVKDGDTVLCILDPLTPSPEAFKMLNDFAGAHHIPFGGTMLSTNKEYDSLFGLNPSNVEMGKQAAELATKILQGSPAGKLPVFSAEPRLTINYKAIKKMGLDVSESVLSRANEIIR